MRKRGKSDYSVECFPCECKDCLGGPDYKFYGCGFQGFEGKSEHEYTKGATGGIFKRTCPQYCISLPLVQRVLSDLNDYKRAALGDIQELEAPYLEYLRMAEAEAENWKSEQEARITNG